MFSIIIKVNNDRILMFILNIGISIIVFKKYIGKFIIIYSVNLKWRKRFSMNVINIEFCNRFDSIMFKCVFR